MEVKGLDPEIEVGKTKRGTGKNLECLQGKKKVLDYKQGVKKHTGLDKASL